MAQSGKRTLAGQCPCPVQGGQSTPAPPGFATALVDSHTVWPGTPVWSELWLCAPQILPVSFVELVFCLHPFVFWSSWGCSVTCAFGHVIHELGFGYSLSFSSFFFLWWKSGKIQNLWHRNEASEWVTGRYTHHWRKPVQEKGDTALTPRWMQAISLKQTKSYPSLHILLCCLRDLELCFCHLQPTGFNGLLSESIQNSFSPNPKKLLPPEAKTLFLLAGLPDNHGWCLFSAGKGP